MLAEVALALLGLSGLSLAAKPFECQQTSFSGDIKDLETGVGFIKIEKKVSTTRSKGDFKFPPTHLACLFACRLDPKCQVVVMDSKVKDASGKGCTLWQDWEKYRLVKDLVEGKVQGQANSLEYYQKVCRNKEYRDAMTKRKCEGVVMTGAMNTIITRKAIKQYVKKEAATLDDCILFCLKNPRCASLQYAYQLPTRDCVLNEQHAKDAGSSALRSNYRKYDAVTGDIGGHDFVEVWCEQTTTSSSSASARVLTASRRRILARRAAIAARLRRLRGVKLNKRTLFGI